MTNLPAKQRWLLSVLLVVGAIEARAAEPPFPPKLPGDKTVVTDRTPKFLKRISKLRAGVEIAKAPPTIDFM
jgi:hypothetical protein